MQKPIRDPDSGIPSGPSLEEHEQLARRVESLEHRLGLLRLEFQGLAHRVEGTSAPNPAPDEQDTDEPLAEPSPAGIAAPEVAPSWEPTPREPASLPQPAPWARGHTPEPAGRHRSTVDEAPSLERRIGGQIFAVAGSLIVIVGLALFAKVAADNGWFRFFSPTLRCVAIAGAGAAFLGAGEFLRSRVRAIAVAGCNAAGIGALYIAGYAAYAIFGLIDSAPAFGLMAGSAAVGLAVALRHGFLSTAMLSLVGAYLVPILLSDSHAGPYVLPTYLLVLSWGAIALATWKFRPFGPMSDLAWLGTGALGLAWSGWQAAQHPWAVVAFWAAAWALHQAGWIVTAARGGAALEADDPTGMHRTITRFRRVRARLEPLVLSVATTTVVIGIVTLVLESQLHLPRWCAPAAAFGVTSVLALTLGGHLRVLRDKPRTRIEALAAAYAAQAGALLIATVALALSGWVEATAWLAMGLGAVVAGRWIGARALDNYGVGLLLIASIRIGTYDLFVGAAGVPWTSPGSSLAIAPWTLLVAGAGVCWAAAAWLLAWTGRDEDDQPGVFAPRPLLRRGALAFAWLAFLAMPLHPETAAPAVMVWWLAYAVVLRALARIERGLPLGVFASITASFTIIPWLAAWPPEVWLASRVGPGTHSGFLSGLLVSGALCAHAWFTRDTQRSPLPVKQKQLLAWLGGATALATTSIEVARAAAILGQDPTAQRAALSIWWGIWGLSLVVGGFVRRIPLVRYAGLALISVGALKAVLLDLAGVPPLWRVASFVGLGALMLVVAVLYGRVSAALDRESVGAGSHGA